MRVLVTNDDGIFAVGILALARALAREHEVVVVAPDRENSAISHKITYDVPVTVLPHAADVFPCNAYSVSGTPADCVKVALGGLLSYVPDMVVAGVNQGGNLANDIPYSGTLSAAREAAMLGVPAVGASSFLSADDWRRAIDGKGIQHMDVAANIAARMAGWLWENPLPSGSFLNVNVPNLPEQALRGVRVAPQGYFEQWPRYHRQPVQGGESYRWVFREDMRAKDEAPDSDVALCKAGYVTVTPLTWRQTDADALQRVRRGALDEVCFGRKDSDA